MFMIIEWQESGYAFPQNIGRVGWADMPASIRVYKRANGEYLMFVEEDGFSKVVMYRWCPTGNCNELPTAMSKEERTQNILVLHPNPAQTELFVTGNNSENATYAITNIEGKAMQ